jgi:DNA mismatch endonuclease (patch repair protein)
MADHISPQKRSWNMAQIKGKGTKPEELVRKYLFSQGFRYRKNVRNLPGCPDIVLPKYRTVVFVNGCFWHKHDCPRFVWPASNKEYWIPKIEGNVARDQQNQEMLRKLGWRVLIVWECQLKKSQIETTLNQLMAEIAKGYDS